MALIQTRQLPEHGEQLTQVAPLVRALRGAAADELSAANLYSEIAGLLPAGEIKERVLEIARDETQHLGSLLWCVGQLDNAIAEDMERGARGG